MLNMENREQILKQILVPLKERYDFGITVEIIFRNLAGTGI